jgi:transcriptional regulator with XRE-family HTH domain
MSSTEEAGLAPADAIERLRALIVFLGISQNVFAAKCRVSKSIVSRVLSGSRGRVRPSPRIALGAKAAFGLSPDYWTSANWRDVAQFLGVEPSAQSDLGSIVLGHSRALGITADDPKECLAQMRTAIERLRRITEGR